jgi:hypothetical protein
MVTLHRLVAPLEEAQDIRGTTIASATRTVQSAMAIPRASSPCVATSNKRCNNPLAHLTTGVMQGLKCNNDKQGNSNNHFDKGKRNNSRNPRKHKPDQKVAAVERNPRGKKSGSNQVQFEKVLHKQCPMHPKSRHMLFECVSLYKSLNAPPLPQDGKRKGLGGRRRG